MAEYQDLALPLEFPRLEPDGPEGCPVPLTDVQEYGEIEAGIPPEELRFVRTADVDGVKFWVWEDLAPTGFDKVYVSVEQYQDSVMLSSDWNDGWLTPEKYMAYHYAKDWR